MSDYISALTGVQMDQALLDMAQHNSEAWAVGNRNGAAVSSTDETYHNNSKYWASRANTYNQNAQAAAARAEAAVPSGTSGAVFFDTAQSLTEPQKGQARTNIGAGNTGVNLIDNPWFTVSQRYETQWSGTGQFTLDRWYHAPSSSDSVCTLLANHEVRLTNTTTTNCIFMQKLPAEKITPLAGGTVTLSINVTGLQDGASWLMHMRWMDANDTQLGFTSVNLARGFNTVSGNVPDDAAYGYFRISGYGGTIRFDRVKLETGRSSTLLNDTAPDYPTELAKCRYYFRLIRNTGNGAAIVGSGYSATTTQARINFADGTPMNPITWTLSMSGDVYVTDANGSHTATAVTSLWATNPLNPPTLAFTSTGLTANTSCTVRLGNNSTLTILADSIN